MSNSVVVKNKPSLHTLPRNKFVACHRSRNSRFGWWVEAGGGFPHYWTVGRWRSEFEAHRQDDCGIGPPSIEDVVVKSRRLYEKPAKNPLCTSRSV